MKKLVSIVLIGLILVVSVSGCGFVRDILKQFPLNFTLTSKGSQDTTGSTYSNGTIYLSPRPDNTNK